MKIKIMSAEELQEHIKNGDISGNAAIISFYDPEPLYDNDYAGALDLSGIEAPVIQLPVADLEEDELRRHGYSYETFFPESAQLASFIYKAAAEDRELICQCVYGISRSAGCAAAILEHFVKKGILIFSDSRYYPSRLVYHKVLDSLKMYRRSLLLNVLMMAGKE